MNTVRIAPICTRLDSYQHLRSDLPWAFLLHPSARERAEGHASRPSEDHTLRLVAFFLYFGLPSISGLRCRDRPPMPGHHAWPKPRTFSPPQFPARDRRLSYFYRRAERKQRAKHRSVTMVLLRPLPPFRICAHPIFRLPGGCGESSMNRIADPHGVLYVKDQPGVELLGEATEIGRAHV